MKRVANLFARGLLIEAIFNSRGRQRGAVLWILGRGAEVDADEPFNANPVLAGYALGSIVSEPERSAGDRSTLAAATAGPIPAAIVLLLVYNPPELALRWRSIRVGLEGSGAVLRDLSGAGLPRLAARIGRLGAGVVGFLGGFWLVGAILSGGIIETVGLLGGVVAALLLFRAASPGIWGRSLVALLFTLLGLIVIQLG